MELPIILILFTVIICVYKNDHHIFNPVITLFSIWMIIIAFYGIRLLEFNEIRFTTYFVMLAGLVTFLLGYSFQKKFQLLDRKKNEKSCVFRYQLIFALCVISGLMLFGTAVNNVLLLRSGLSFNEINIQRIMSGEVNSGSGLQKSISVLLVQPFSYALLPIWAVDYLVGKRKKWLTFFTVLIVILFSLQTGRRFIILYAVTIFILVKLCLGIKFEFGRKEKRIAFIVIALAAGGIVYLSAARGISNLGRSFYVYICGCIPHLDYRLSEISYTGQYTFGLTAVSGYLTPLFIGAKGVLGIPYPDFWIRATQLFNVENVVTIGENVKYNAFVTPFFYFYLDGGFLGVILGMFLYGIVASGFYQKLQWNTNNLTVCCYALIELGLIFSMFQLYFVSYPYALSFLYVWLLCKGETCEGKALSHYGRTPE